MKSRLAEQARLELAERLRQMTAEQRLDAFLRHCELVTALHRAGRELGPNPEPHGVRDAV